MPKNKGKPSGPYAESKKTAGKQGDYKRSGWPEDAPTQHDPDARAKQVGSPLAPEELPIGSGAGRDRKAGGPD